MWVDIDDLRKEIKNLEREDSKGLREMDVNIRSVYNGMLVGYKKVEQILDEMEEDYRKREDEYSRGMEEGNEE